MRFEKRFFGLMVLSLAAIFAGCTPPEDPVMDMIESDLRKTKVNDLSRTMDFVFSEIRFSQKEFKNKISTGLNRWVSYSKDQLDRIKWDEDSISKPLCDANETLSMLQRNDEYSFLSTDAYYLQESAWIGEITDRLVASKQLNAFELYRLAADNYKPDEDVEQPLTEVIKKLNPGLDDQQSQDLASSLKIFDWVVRNIQLLPEPELTEVEIEEARLNDKTGSNAQAGVPGLGYQRYPWQVLTYGRGDYVERAKVIMLALRHLDLDSVMLATRSDDGQSRPWAVGVPIGGEYYLFDTKMGLPIPGKTTGSIATLSEIRKDPQLISSLDLTTEESLEEDTQYWVKPEQLKQLDALIYVSPESISRRMLGLESSLIGNERLTLAFTADEIASRLPKVEGVEVKAWDVAFQTHEFRQAVREALEQTSNNVLTDKLTWHFLDEAYVDNFVVYRTARARFFKGKFKTDQESTLRNAVESFQRLMYTDTEVDNLGSDKKLQQRLGIRKEADQSAQSFLQEVQSVQMQMRLVRRDAGFFLSQCLYDNGSVNAAANWLLVLRDEEDADRWKDGVTYLLGRSFEGRKEYDESIEVLSDPKTTQAHGNLIRVRILKELISKL
jgi:hypothetical protein